MRLRTALSAVVVMAAVRPELPPVRVGALLVDDPAALETLEDRGWAFDHVLGPLQRASLRRVVREDMAEFTARAASDTPRRPFDPSWLERGKFELVGVVNRLDRRAFEPTTCGELRLVYRLALKNRGRPTTRLPMTVNVRLPQPKPAGDDDCRNVALRWRAGAGLQVDPRHLPAGAKVEINFQSIHVPSSQADMDDNAEYVMRAFDVTPEGLQPARLFNTVRLDLPGDAREAYLGWVSTHLPAIDQGVAVVPDEFLATRVVTVSPRGLVHAQNRPVSRVLGGASTLQSLDLRGMTVATSPELLLRRLDEAGCPGCHQTRGVAGFHLLGEERDARARFNALAVGHSPHLGADLAWRAVDLDRAARGQAPLPRPFAAFPDGRAGSECGLGPGVTSLGCAPGLVCRDVHHADFGVCAPATGQRPGDPCELVTVTSSDRAVGALVTARAADATCPLPSGPSPDGPFCAPNWLGFTGGMCSTRCTTVGEVDDDAICAPLPAAGYEADCFGSREPIEKCLERHFVTAKVASCDASRPCRDDYGCARVPGAPKGVGACVPPYFIFQARVDGPALDR